MRNLYNSDEWRSLNGVDRAQLLLVIEGLKRGTIINGNWTSFMDILKKTGLGYELNTSRYSLHPVVAVAKPEVLKERNRRYLTLSENANKDDFDKVTGWFLGYPECCTAEYVKDRTPEQIRAERNGQRHLSYKFGQELAALIESDGEYEEIFDYRPPSFTPCRIGCSEATRALKTWKDAIDTLDPEAGRELVYFNRRNFPERLAHEEYLWQEGERRNLEFKLEMLRGSIQ